MINIALIIMGASIILLGISNILLKKRMDVEETISYYDHKHLRTKTKKFDCMEKKLSILETRIKILSRALNNSRETNKMNTLIEKVKMWSNERNLNNGNSDKQLLKLFEEAGEVAEAYNKGYTQDLMLESGDVLITLIIFAQQQGFDLNECLELAYNKISNRTGKLVDGVYIKQEDLIAQEVNNEK